MALSLEALVGRASKLPRIELRRPPSAIGARIANSLPVLAADVNQTIFKAVIVGYVIAGFTGGGQEFVRSYAERVYGIGPAEVIGSPPHASPGSGSVWSAPAPSGRRSCRGGWTP